MKEKLVSFVIPCYCSSRTIESVVDEIQTTMESRKESCEIILINDCSPDDGETNRKIQELVKEKENIVGINFSKNFGQHSALMAGLRASRGDYVVCLDDDGQTPAKEVGKLIDALGEDCDVVYASYAEKKHSAFRNFGTKMNLLMCKYLLGKPDDIFISSYFVTKKFVVDEIIKYNNPYPFIEGLVLRVTRKIKNVEVNHQERQAGESGYTFSKLLNLWINGFTSFSVLPLRLASLLGVGCAFVGFIYMIITIIQKCLDPTMPVGWASIMCVLLIVSGIIMIILGMIGEYIGRVYISLNNSPQYVIRDIYTKE